MNQFVITPAAGKRLIARATAAHPAVQTALKSGTVVIVAGTTNGYVAEEILKHLGQSAGFDRNRFFRGITLPPCRPTTETGRLPDESRFAGDVVIVNGVWQPGVTIFDVADNLKEGDVILKGANAVDLSRRRAAILVGHSKGGTIAIAMQAVTGRRVRLILPVGLEKRVTDDLDRLAGMLNVPGVHGPRLFPAPGEIITEIEALSLLTGVTTEVVAAGGVCGAEGSVWLAIAGNLEQEESAQRILKEVAGEPPFMLGQPQSDEKGSAEQDKSSERGDLRR
jgi:hypothetical protein